MNLIRLILILATVGLAACDSSPPAVKSWPGYANDHLGTGVRLSLKTRWSDKTLSYIVTISPASDMLKKKRVAYGVGPSFTVQFKDDSGVIVLRDSFLLKQMTAVVDGDGEPMRFEYQHEVKCDRVLYRSLKEWGVPWSMKD